MLPACSMRHYWCLLACIWMACAQAHAGFLNGFFGTDRKFIDSQGLLVRQIDESLQAKAAPPLTPALVEPSAPKASDYRLGPGDRINITVFNEKDLSLDVRLSDAGSFLYPFIGEVSAKGLTIGDLQTRITAALAEGYLVDPKVYVSILEYRPFFVNGEVVRPGGYPYQPGLTIRTAIALAGGVTPRASLTKIYVIHEGGSASAPRLTSLSAELQPGDTIIVDQSFF